MSKFQVGDTVILLDRKHIVDRVGRKYVYLEDDWRKIPYDAKSGRQSDSHSRRYGGATLYTVGEWESAERLRKVKAALVDRHNLSPACGNWSQSVETLEKLLTVLDEDAMEALKE